MCISITKQQTVCHCASVTKQQTVCHCASKQKPHIYWESAYPLIRSLCAIVHQNMLIQKAISLRRKYWVSQLSQCVDTFRTLICHHRWCCQIFLLGSNSLLCVFYKCICFINSFAIICKAYIIEESRKTPSIGTFTMHTTYSYISIGTSYRGIPMLENMDDFLYKESMVK